MPELVALLGTLAPRFEIIVVDDGSTDATHAVLAEWASRQPEVVCIQLSRNFGKEAAISAGLEAAQGQVVVLMDADFQHPPALIPAMVERWSQGVEMVYAVRASRADETIFKRLGTRLFYHMLRTSDGLHVPENAGDFRLMDRVVVDALMALPERTRFMKGLFAWVGFRSEPMYYSPPERLHGQSHFKALKLFRLAMEGLTAFTTWPLRLLSLVGLCLALLSFTYGLYIVLAHWLYGDPVQGWATLITLILFFEGVSLLSVGVVGEYIARIFGEVKHRPLYVVRHKSGEGLGVSSSSDSRK